MRVIQLVAVGLLIASAAAASFTVWQIVDTTAAEPQFRGPAPVLVGDAPPPATSTADAIVTSTPPSTTKPDPSQEPSSPTATATDPNLAPPTQPISTPTSTPEPSETTAEETSQAVSGTAHSATRQPPQPHAAPTYLRIPRIDINPLIIPVGLNERGEMASPTDYFEVGWWQYGAAPGDYGRAVLAGHVDTPTGKAVFYGIDQLAPGDEIFVGNQDPDSPELRFVVTGAALYHIDYVPVDQIFGPSTERELILITCGGSFDHETGQYLYRRVVFAKLATDEAS